jgi:peptide/nickel transport system ATP-binding protein
MTAPAHDPTAEPLLAVESLSVRFAGRRGVTQALRGVGFRMGREKVAVVGESGSGKSTLGRALLRLVPPTGLLSGRILFQGEDILRMPEREVRRLRGRRIAMILQDARSALDPVIPVGPQIAESWRAHARGTQAEARARAIEMLDSVHIDDPERVYDSYPHQLSGGMGQRAMIAMMLVAGPDLLIADEPTSALDATVRLRFLSVLDEAVRDRGMGLLFITHDLGLVASFCDRVLVMYAGRIVESCAAADLENARHPYTRGLLAARPALESAPGPLRELVRDPAWLEAPDGEAGP